MRDIEKLMARTVKFGQAAQTCFCNCQFEIESVQHFSSPLPFKPKFTDSDKSGTAMTDTRWTEQVKKNTSDVSSAQEDAPQSIGSYPAGLPCPDRVQHHLRPCLLKTKKGLTLCSSYAFKRTIKHLSATSGIPKRAACTEIANALNLNLRTGTDY